jgi:hypothetical protein
MKSTEKKVVKEKHKPRYKLIYNYNAAMKKSTIILIALISVSYFVSRSNAFFFASLFSRNIINRSNSLVNYIEVIFKIILSIYFFKLTIYNHHILSIILITIAFLPFFIYEMISIIQNRLFDVFFLVLERIGFSIGEILSKIAFNKDMILPEKLIFFRGVLTFLLNCFIICPILYFSGQTDIYRNFVQFLSDFSILTTIRIIFYTFIIFFQNIIFMKIIYFYTPIHTSLFNSIIIYLMCVYLFYSIERLNPLMTLLTIILAEILLMIIIFGVLAFCEIIVINKCGLNNHTKFGSLGTIELVMDTLNEEQEI